MTEPRTSQSDSAVLAGYLRSARSLLHEAANVAERIDAAFESRCDDLEAELNEFCRWVERRA